MNQIAPIKVFGSDGALYRGQIHCPECKGLETVVLETRGRFAADRIIRRRKCSACSHRFTTRESFVTEIHMPPLREKLARAEKALAFVTRTIAELHELMKVQP